jgi:C4-dicarboxylate transporter, DctM subunit
LIWFGLCTPTEGAGIGAVGGLIRALIKGISLRDARRAALCARGRILLFRS